MKQVGSLLQKLSNYKKIQLRRELHCNSESIKAIYQLCGVSEPVFKQYFLPVIETVENVVRSPSARALASHSEANSNNFDGWLDVVSQALRKRRGAILPVNGSEDRIVRLHDVYTYAVFAALSVDVIGKYYSTFMYLEHGKGIPLHGTDWAPVPLEETRGVKEPVPGFGLALLHGVIGEEAWRWLNSDSDVLRDFVCFFTSKSESAIYQLTNVVQMKNSEDSTEYEKPRSDQRQREEYSNIPQRSAGWDFVDSVADAVRVGKLKVNQRNAPLWFSSDARLLLLEDVLFSWYARQVEGDAVCHRRRFRRLAIVELRKNRNDRFLAKLPCGKTVRVMVVSKKDSETFFGIKTSCNSSVTILQK